jgi:hypothetical protein
MADNPILDAQGTMANQNPNIISPTYTGANAPENQTTPLQAPPAVPQLPATTGMPEAANVASNLSQQLYGGGMMQGLESQRNSMMQELYDYDNQLGTIYQGGSQFPQYDWYVENPNDRMAGLSSIAGATGANIARTTGAIDVTERAYNTAISNVLDKFLSFYQLQQQQAQFDREYQLKEKELISRIGGGDKTKKQQEALQMLYQGAGINTPQVDEQGNIIQAAAGPAPAATQVNKNALWQAIAHDPENMNTYITLWDKMVGQEGMDDFEAIRTVSTMPGGFEALQLVNAEQRGEYARTILKSGTAQSGVQVPMNLTTSQQEQISALQSFNENIEKMRAQFKNLKLRGPMMGVAGEQLSKTKVFAQDIRAYDTTREAMAFEVGKAIFGQSSNSFSDVDRAAALAQLPDATSKDDYADVLFNQLKAKGQTRLAALGLAQPDMAGATTEPSLPGYQPIQSPMGPTVEAAPSTNTRSDGKIPVEEIATKSRGWIFPHEFNPMTHIRLK